jgi:hypothetical protein
LAIGFAEKVLELQMQAHLRAGWNQRTATRCGHSNGRGIGAEICSDHSRRMRVLSAHARPSSRSGLSGLKRCRVIAVPAEVPAEQLKTGQESSLALTISGRTCQSDEIGKLREYMLLFYCKLRSIAQRSKYNPPDRTDEDAESCAGLLRDAPETVNSQ